MFRASARAWTRLFKFAGKAENAIPVAESSAAGSARARTFSEKAKFGAREVLIAVAAGVGANAIDDWARDELEGSGTSHALGSSLEFLTRTNLTIHGSTVALYLALRRLNPLPAGGLESVAERLAFYRRSPATLAVFVGLSFYVYGALTHELFSSARVEAMCRNREAREAGGEEAGAWSAEGVLREAAGRLDGTRVAATAAIAPVCEEVVYRGLLLQRLAAGAGGLAPGLVLSSLVFSNMHELASVARLLREFPLQCPHRFWDFQERLHRLNLDLLELAHGAGRWDEARRRLAAFRGTPAEPLSTPIQPHVIHYRDPTTMEHRAQYLHAMTADDVTAAKAWSRRVVDHIESEPRPKLYARLVASQLQTVVEHPRWGAIAEAGQARVDSGLLYGLAYLACGGRLWVPVVLHARHNLGCVAVEALAPEEAPASPEQ